MHKYFLFLFLLIPFSVDAQCVKIVTTRTEVNPETKLKERINSHGSGITVKKLKNGKFAVLTAAHVVQNRETIHVLWNNEKVPASLISVNYSAATDVALISSDLKGAKEHQIVNYRIKPLTPIAIHGYPLDNPLTVITGKTESLNDMMLLCNSRVNFGNSGGPVLYNNYIVGVVYAFDPTTPTVALQTSGHIFYEWADKHLNE